MDEMTSRLVKIIVVGDGNVGKTSLVRQYCEGKFEVSRVATIGVDFQTKLVKMPAGFVKLSIWDMAGQQHFKYVREGFYRGSRAGALVYDVTNEDSLKNLLAWRQEVLRALPGIPLLLVGNKCDLEHAKVLLYGKTLSSRLGIAHVTTSAMTGEGVEEMFSKIASLATQ